MTNRMREDLTEHALSLDMAFHGRHTPGEMIERVDGDVTALSEFMSRFLLQTVGSALLLMGTVVVVTLEDLRVGAVLVAFLLVAGFVVVRFQRMALPAATAERQSVAQVVGLRGRHRDPRSRDA